MTSLPASRQAWSFSGSIAGMPLVSIGEIPMTSNAMAIVLAVNWPAQAPAVPQGFLNGPVADATGRTDVVSGQAQVDSLLESLGF